MQLDNQVICQFRFICGERWEDLTSIEGEATQRFCTVCKSHVYLTTNYEELEKNISAKRCVAIFLENAEGPAQKFMGFTVPAMPSPPGSLDPILFRPVVEIEVPDAIVKRLNVNNVRRVGDLVHCTQTQLVEQFGMTKIELDDVMEVLASRGLSLGMNIENWSILSAKKL